MFRRDLIKGLGAALALPFCAKKEEKPELPKMYPPLSHDFKKTPIQCSGTILRGSGLGFYGGSFGLSVDTGKTSLDV